MTVIDVGIPFRAADYLTPSDLSSFLAEALADGDCRALPLTRRTVADVIMSAPGRLRLDTVAAILSGFGLRVIAVPVDLQKIGPRDLRLDCDDEVGIRQRRDQF